MSASLTTDLRLLKLERRVDRLERRLAIDSPIEPATEPAIEPATERATERAAESEGPFRGRIESQKDPWFRETNSGAPVAPVSPPPEPMHEPAGVPDERGYIAPPVEHTPAELVARNVTPPPLPPTAHSPRLSYAAMQSSRATRQPAPARHLEQTIGLKWAGWIGAVVLVIGAVLGIKYAYDNHLLPSVGPAGRMSLIVCVGAALLAAGEYVYRKINKISAAGLFGAGVATLFVAAYVGHAYYELYSQNVAMTLMGAASLIGAAVAMRGNLVSIAVLSLVGANVAPMLVASRGAPIGPFLVYLLAMQVVALALASWGRAGKWWTLRGLSLAATALWMVGVLVSPNRTEPIVLGFTIAYAILYHVELIVSTLLAKSPFDQAHGRQAANRNVGVTFAFAVTTALTIGVLWYFQAATQTVRATWVMSIAGASFILGIALPRLRDSLKPLAQSHRISAAALLVLAIPIATNGLRAEIGWMMLAITFGVSWIVTGSRVSRVAAPITWGLALLHLALRATGSDHAPAEVWLTISGTAIASHAILFGVFAIVGQIVARLISTTRDGIADPRNDRAIRVMSIAATLVWAAAAVAYVPALGATTAIVLYAWLLMSTDRIAPRLAFVVQAGALLLLATVKWAIVDTLAQRLAPGWSPNEYLPVLNPMMGVGALVTASLVALYYLKRRPILLALKRDTIDDRTRGGMLLIIAVVALVTIGLSFEVEHIVERANISGRHLIWPLWQTKQLAWTALWSIASVSIAALVSRLFADRDDRARRLRVLWILPLALIAKYVFIDTLMYRVAGVSGARALLNLQMLAGIAVVGSLMLVRSFTDGKRVGMLRQLRGGVGMLVLAMIAWMGTLEIDRAVSRGSFSFLIPIATSGALIGHVKMLLFTVWWSVLTGAAYVIGCRFDRTASTSESWVRLLPAAMLLIAVKYLLVDAIVWRVGHSPVPWPLLANVEAMAAAAVVGMLMLLRFIRPPTAATARIESVMRFAMTLIVATLFIGGTLEVDRAFALPSIRAALTNARLAAQVALSIYWAIFAVLSVAIGFRVRASALRYFGLTLLAITLLKVVVIDLSQVGTGYRILSFIGLGLLLLGTSVLYGFVSPKLLAGGGEKRDTSPGGGIQGTGREGRETRVRGADNFAACRITRRTA